MLDSKKINEVVEKLLNTLPAGMKALPEDLSRNFHQTLENIFNELNLVTREEFDAQVAVLHRTRAKLEQLEEKLNAL